LLPVNKAKAPHPGSGVSLVLLSEEVRNAPYRVIGAKVDILGFRGTRKTNGDKLPADQKKIRIVYSAPT
jgi:hypothetical protein